MHTSGSVSTIMVLRLAALPPELRYNNNIYNNNIYNNNIYNNNIYNNSIFNNNIYNNFITESIILSYWKTTVW